ncbi:MAG TPA: ribonuclease PH, partial [Planctomycetota bacterium]|nr:ribonuclease PH [Planctomycetota bacterium]
MAKKRRADQLRDVSFQRHYTEAPYGSVLVAMGKTRVLCTASVVEGVPPWLRGRGEGWVTAEYAMLPGATRERRPRRDDGRAAEIQRLVGRSLRAVVDRLLLGERTLWLDCDVLQADGGTRTAAVNGSYMALVDALTRLKAEGALTQWPLRAALAAVSVGIVDGRAVLDLDYALDSEADVDMKIVMTSRGEFVELQGTAEHGTFDGTQLSRMLRLARKGIRKLFELQ